MLKEVTVKIKLERIYMQEKVTVEMLLDSGITSLVISSEFARKQGFKLKKKDLLLGAQGNNRDRCNWRVKVECNFGNAMACSPQS